MVEMDTIVQIRNMFFEEGLSMTEISRELKLDRKTIAKYVDKNDFNEKNPIGKAIRDVCPKLNPWKAWINETLEMNEKRKVRKQKYNGYSLFKTLLNVFPGFPCSYVTVNEYFKFYTALIRDRKSEGFIPLTHLPGECQGDFGEAEFVENGIETVGKYFVLDFPYSNNAFSQLKRGENMECLLEAMDAIFHEIGGVPNVIWFDNASTMVTDVIRGGGRKLTEKFSRFLEHYKIKAVFMNPYSGNEKGAVENKVGYIRRHMLVPVPEFKDLEEFNKEFFELQWEDSDRLHYIKMRNISDLFLEDMKEFHPLPEIEFALYSDRTYKTDKYGFFTIDDKYNYSTSPEYRNELVHVRLTSSTVTVFDNDGSVLTEHRRLYGKEVQKSIAWGPYLKLMSRKPRSFLNSDFAGLVPEKMRIYLCECDNSVRGRYLEIMSEIYEFDGFDKLLQFCETAVRLNNHELDKFEMLYRGIHAQSDQNVKAYESSRPKVNAYDDLLKFMMERNNGNE